MTIADGADKTCLSSSVLRGSKEKVQSVSDDLAELLSSKVGPDVVFDVTIPGRHDVRVCAWVRGQVSRICHIVTGGG